MEINFFQTHNLIKATTFSLRQSGTNEMKWELKFIYESRPIIQKKYFIVYIHILVYEYTKMYLLLIIGNYKNICKKIMIFFHGHIFDLSEYFATDSQVIDENQSLFLILSRFPYVFSNGYQ